MHGLYAKGFTWQDAEDLTHFAFLQMLRYPPAPTNPRGWLWRVAHNAARSRIGHRTRFPAVGWHAGLDARPDPVRVEAVCVAADGARALLAVLDTLTPGQRAVLLLTAAGEDDAAIGRRLGRTANAVKALRFRARQAAQKRLAG